MKEPLCLKRVEWCESFVEWYPPNILSLAVASGVHVWQLWTEPFSRYLGSGAGEFSSTLEKWMNAWHFQELLSKNEVELQVCKLDWGCTIDEEAWVGLRWWIGAWKNAFFFFKRGLSSNVAGFFGSEEQSRIGNWLNMARMLTVEIQNFYFFIQNKDFQSFVKFGDVSLRPSWRTLGSLIWLLEVTLFSPRSMLGCVCLLFLECLFRGISQKGAQCRPNHFCAFLRKTDKASSRCICGEWFETFFLDWFQIFSLAKSCKKFGGGPWGKLPRIWTNSSAVVALY